MLETKLWCVLKPDRQREEQESHVPVPAGSGNSRKQSPGIRYLGHVRNTPPQCLGQKDLRCSESGNKHIGQRVRHSRRKLRFSHSLQDKNEGTRNEKAFCETRRKIPSREGYRVTLSTARQAGSEFPYLRHRHFLRGVLG